MHAKGLSREQADAVLKGAYGHLRHAMEAAAR
jgi:hypothetical protein